MSGFATLVFVSQTTVLVAATLLLMYPVIAYRQNVAHTRGMLLLAGSFLVLTATYVTSFVFGLNLVSAALDLISTLFLIFGTWEFARPFISFGNEEIETPPVSDTTGGFENAQND